MSKRPNDGTGLIELSREECLELLGGERIGRVGVTVRAIPVILPVNYVMIDDCIVFRTVVGTKLAVATYNAVVAFEADSYDLDGIAGWSVLAVGRSSVIVEPAMLARLRTAPLEAWAVSEAAHDYVQVEATRLTGRRFDHRPPMEVGHVVPGQAPRLARPRREDTCPERGSGANARRWDRWRSGT